MREDAHRCWMEVADGPRNITFDAKFAPVKVFVPFRPGVNAGHHDHWIMRLCRLDHLRSHSPHELTRATSARAQSPSPKKSPSATSH
jgi:hypothetical protein